MHVPCGHRGGCRRRIFWRRGNLAPFQALAAVTHFQRAIRICAQAGFAARAVAAAAAAVAGSDPSKPASSIQRRGIHRQTMLQSQMLRRQRAPETFRRLLLEPAV